MGAAYEADVPHDEQPLEPNNWADAKDVVVKMTITEAARISCRDMIFFPERNLQQTRRHRAH